MPFLVYVVALLLTAGAFAIGVDYLTTPDFKSDKPMAAAVKQVPIGSKSTAHLGDPNNVLTPIYPTNPGKELPLPEAEVVKPAATAEAETTGSGGSAQQQAAAAQNAGDAVPAPVVSIPPPSNAMPAQSTSVTSNAPPNSCAMQACASAYRSFRATDCSYQPYEGPRQTCDLDGDSSTASNAARVRQPQQDRARRQSRGDELNAAVRAVRRLPGPDVYEDLDRGRIVVIEEPDGSRYDLRRNWIYEER